MEFKALAFFLLLTAITFGAYWIITASGLISSFSSNPLVSMLLMIAIGTGIWVAFYYLTKSGVMSSTKAAMKPMMAIILIAVLAGGVFVTYAVYASQTQPVGDNRGFNFDDVTDGISDLFGFSGTEPLSSANYVTVYCEDGSVYHYNSEQMTAQAIIDSASGKAVSNLQMEVYIKATYTGTVTSYTVSGGNLQMIVTDTTTGQVVFTGPSMAMVPFNPLPALVSDNSVVITSATISAFNLEKIQSSWVNGHNYKVEYKMATPMSVKLTFDDGSSAINSASAPTLVWNFKYLSSATGGFTNLNISFNKVVS